MRDDLYELTRDERVRARADWRQLTPQDRREACRLAKQGRAATDEDVSSAARRHGQYLLVHNRSNRMPRWALPAAGVLLAVVGAVVGATPVAVPGGLGVIAIGLLSWSQRRWGHLLVAANGMTTSSNTTPSRS